LEGQAEDEQVQRQIDELLGSHRLDLVLSDMAPNISGVRAVDQARAMDLADITLAAGQRWLRKGGSLVLKAFQGEGLDEWMGEVKKQFKTAKLTKPKASRDESREVFVVARGWRSTTPPSDLDRDSDKDQD
jgi:23S rRNA (uridine2552-2'-O)-methyltransferase